jgi:DNA-binding IclR family transcriptional regulator
LLIYKSARLMCQTGKDAFVVTTVSRTRQGIQSIEVGFRLISALVAHGRPMMLRDLAASAGMPAAKAHRYLVSFMRAGLVDQDNATSRYTLGSFALELGLASLGRLDPVRLADPILDALCEEIQETVALAVWGNMGATIVRRVDSGDSITVSLRAGSVLSLANSATGRAFTAFSRTPSVRKLLDQELKQASEASNVASSILRRNMDKAIAETREHGIARASGSLTPGINGFSAPVFDHSGAMVAAITSLGAVGHFDSDWHSPIARAIKQAAETLSQRLGYRHYEAEQQQPEEDTPVKVHTPLVTRRPRKLRDV